MRNIIISLLISFLLSGQAFGSFGAVLGAGGGAVPTYANFGSFPVSAPEGTLATDQATGDVYVFQGGTWNLTGSPSILTTIGALDGQAKTANGASVSGNTLYMQSADASFPGVLSAADWIAFDAKEPAIAATTSLDYYRGDKTFQTLNTDAVVEAANLYFTNVRAQTAAVADAIVDAITNVAPSQNAVFDALALKEDSVVATTSLDYYRGDKTFQTLDTLAVPENTNLYFTDARAKSAAVADAIVDAVVDVAPSQNAVFDALALKEDSIVAATSLDYYRGDKTFQTLDTDAVAEASNLYFTDARAKSAAVADAIVDSVVDVAPSQNAVFDALALKEDSIVATTSLDYYRGDKTFQTLNTDAVVEGTNLYYTQSRFDTAFGLKSTTDLSEGTNLYYTDARARAAVSATAPLAYVSATGVFSMPAAATAQDGYLTSVDWNTFNNKQPAGSYITALTGDVTATGPGSVAATIANDAVTNAKLANMATQTFKGRTTAGSGDPEDLTATQATAMLDTFTDLLKGLAPASGGGTTNFLRADGTWAAPAGAGDVVGPASSVDGEIVLFDGATGKLIKRAVGTGVVHSTAGVFSVANVDLTSEVTGILPNGNTTATSANTASAIVARDASGDFSAGIITASLSGNASTATALAANPTDCAAGQKATAIDASGNLTCSAVSLTADVSGVLPVANGGTNSSAALNNNRVMVSSAGAISEAAAITASRVLASDINGLPVATSITDVEIGYVSGVTSGIQAQLDAKQASFTDIQEVPAGAVNNSNTAFTLSQTPVSNASVSLHQDGLVLVQGVDYTVSGVNITMTTAPNFFQQLYAVYKY